MFRLSNALNNPSRFSFRSLFLLAWLLVSAAAGTIQAQTLNVTQGKQTYATLINTTVTLSGVSELHITGTGDPFSGTTVNLTSEDSWFYLDNIRPSVVASNYLSRVKVNGISAVMNSNVRVVQYAVGTVVIPHASNYQPMEAFTGTHFTGSSRKFSLYTYYNSASALGTFNKAISSFKLKHGYMATIATQANGTGSSQVYIAQDADLEVSVLPSQFENAVQFVRVFPWRWVGKKGSCDVSPTTLDATWYYNWNNDQESTLDYEYVPIRQQRWWPGYPTSKQNVTHLLGFNEPDNPVEDSYTSLGNGSVDAAIAVWPELMSMGLRLGSPAVTDGGESWLYDFIDKADAAGLRVDYVAIHFYRCGYSASSLYNWLKGIHDRTGRPIWVTEFNNGANWTGCADPTYAQNASTIADFIDMMDNTPWIERYAVYSNVEAVRQMTYSDGSLTPAGEIYKANTAPISYVQQIPATGWRGQAQFPFENSTQDTSGFGNNAIAVGAPAYVSGQKGQALQLNGSDQYLVLPNKAVHGTDFTFAAWVKWNGGANWQRIFDFGNDQSPGSTTGGYMFLTPNNGSGMRFTLTQSGYNNEQRISSSSPLPSGSWQHVAVTLSGGTARMYLNGSQIASGSISITPSTLSPIFNYIGKSQFTADPMFSGAIDDIVIKDTALSQSQIAALMNDTPPTFSVTTVTGGTANQGQPYSGSVAGLASDTDNGQTLTYSKATGPAWLNVSSTGALSGTPTYADQGTQNFTLCATDTAGVSAYTVLNINLPTVLGNGTWTADTDGTWSDTAMWANGFPANGIAYTADFSTINITSDRLVTLDFSHPIGNLTFGDTSGRQNWTLASSNGNELELDTGSSASPVITVSQNTATITAPLSGTNGLTKSGVGTLVLASGNTLTGTLNVDTGSTSTSQGRIRASHPNAIANIGSIAIRTNNSGSSTLELDGSSGDISTPASLSLSGRNNSVVALRNITGANSINGGLILNSGGGNYVFQSDAGTLTIEGTTTSTASGSRPLTFNGNGNFAFNGAVTLGSATDIGIIKNGTGSLTFSGSGYNLGPGTLAINAGQVDFSNGSTPGSGNITLASGTSLTLEGTTTLSQTVSGSGAITTKATCTITGSLSSYTGSFTHDSISTSVSFNTSTATSRYASYTLASVSRASQGMIAGGTGNFTLEMGSLSGVSGSLFRGSFSGSGVATLQIGNLNQSTSFDGSIADGTKTLALTKVGTGTLVLGGNNSYSGATAVNSGNLQVDGSLGNSPVTVASGAKLSGTGLIGGSVNMLSGSNLAPGSTSLGTLQVSNSLTLQSGSALTFYLDSDNQTNDKLVVTGVFTRGGSLVVLNQTGTLNAGDSFDLFDAGTVTGDFALVTLPTLTSGLQWNTDSIAQGVITVESTVPTYADWVSGYNLTAGQDTFTSDPDGDGIANGMEWILGSDPQSPDSSNDETVALVSGSEIPNADASKHYLTLTAKVRKSFAGATLVAQANVSLAQIDSTASESNITSFQVSDQGDFEERSWVFMQAIEDTPEGRAFIRLKLTSE